MKYYVEQNGLDCQLQKAFSGRTPHNILLNIIAVMWIPHNRYRGLNLHNVWYRGTVEFRYFNGTLHAGKIKAYVQFCLALGAKAINSNAASSRKRDLNPISSKYDFRVFLLGLGLIGDEFKTARQHLLSNLEGDSAFKNGRPQTEQVA